MLNIRDVNKFKKPMSKLGLNSSSYKPKIALKSINKFDFHILWKTQP